MGEKQFFPALTGVRAVSVYFIFIKHLNFFSPETHPNLCLFVNQFYAFLDFFFVLSGFLIYYRYNEISSFDKGKLYNYFINRISRVFPILLLLISITFFLSYYHGYTAAGETVKVYLLNISLLKGFSSKYYLSGIGPSWSLSVEELFYLLSPLIFFHARNIKSLIRFVLLSVLAGVLITLLFSLHPFEGFFSSYNFTIYSTFFGRSFEFACGIFVGMLVKNKLNIPFLTSTDGKTLYAGLAIILGSLFLLFFIARVNSITHAIDTWAGIFVNNIILPVGIMFTFCSLVYHRSWLQRFLSTPLMVQLGNSTYSFYLLHTTFVLSYIFKFISQNFFIAFIMMVIISIIFQKTVEQPLTVFFRRRFSKKISL